MDTTDYLKSIDNSLKLLVKQQVTAAPKLAYSPQQLDTEHGNPVTRKMPKFWTGDDHSGKHYSECPPELLDMIADNLDWSAGKADEKQEVTTAGKPISGFKRMDAARARGWAKRKRDGWLGPQVAAPPPPTGWANAPKEGLAAWGSPVNGDDITF